ncbi:hypothetical protein GBA52_003632 [Prunus armeniaca]|nr:hypothetical protein GBA52_003632 [Prunus armeniaca]
MDSFPEWLGGLTSLRLLNIKSCKNLMHLPTVRAMQRLTKLKTLTIYDCPLLKERCTNERGLEWHKISHIPIILLTVLLWELSGWTSGRQLDREHTRSKLGDSISAPALQRLGVLFSFRASASGRLSRTEEDNGNSR